MPAAAEPALLRSRRRAQPSFHTWKFHMESSCLWARSTKNTDWSTGPLTHPFAHSLAPLTCLLAPHYSLRSLACLLCSLPSSRDSDWLDRYLFCIFSILALSVFAYLKESEYEQKLESAKIQFFVLELWPWPFGFLFVLAQNGYSWTYWSLQRSFL